MATVAKHGNRLKFESLEGMHMTHTLETRDGTKYHVVRRTDRLAAVIIEGAEELDFTLVSEGGGGFETIEKGVIDTLVDWGAAALKLGKKLLTGGCYTQNTQTATFDPKTGNMTGFTNTTTVVCSPD